MESYNFNHISHSARGGHKIHFDDQEETKSEKKHNISFANVSDNCSTHASTDAEYSPDRKDVEEDSCFGTQLNVIMEKGESTYEQPRLRTDEEVRHHRAILDAKSRAYDEEAERINDVKAMADGVHDIVAQTNAMIDNWQKAQEEDLNAMYRHIWGMSENQMTPRGNRHLDITVNDRRAAYRSSSNGSRASARSHRSNSRH